MKQGTSKEVSYFYFPERNRLLFDRRQEWHYTENNQNRRGVYEEN